MSYTSQTFTNGQKLSADPLNKMNAALVDHENNKAGKSEIPTKTSQLTNDSNFITNAVNDLVNYYKKSETYTQEEINQKLSAIPKFSIQPVDSLPTADISTTTVYLVKSGEESQNLYTEYIYVNGQWEYLGKQTVELTGYALKTDIPTTLPASDVYSWAKQPAKPTYTADEVGAVGKETFNTLTLGIHTDGLLYIFINGEPTGNGIELPKIYGYVDSENNVVIMGNLAEGTYTLVYEDADGEQTTIGGFTLGKVLELFVPATCAINSRLNSSGAVSSQNGTFLTDYIDIGDLAVGETRDILFSGFQIQMGRASSPYTGFGVYDVNKNYLGKGATEYNDSIEYDESGQKTFKATIDNPSTGNTARYIRIYGHLGEEYETQGTTALTSIDQLADCSLILGS